MIRVPGAFTSHDHNRLITLCWFPDIERLRISRHTASKPMYHYVNAAAQSLHHKNVVAISWNANAIFLCSFASSCVMHTFWAHIRGTVTQIVRIKANLKAWHKSLRWTNKMTNWVWIGSWCSLKVYLFTETRESVLRDFIRLIRFQHHQCTPDVPQICLRTRRNRCEMKKSWRGTRGCSIVIFHVDLRPVQGKRPTHILVLKCFYGFHLVGSNCKITPLFYLAIITNILLTSLIF